MTKPSLALTVLATLSACTKENPDYANDADRTTTYGEQSFVANARPLLPALDLGGLLPSSADAAGAPPQDLAQSCITATEIEPNNQSSLGNVLCPSNNDPKIAAAIDALDDVDWFKFELAIGDHYEVWLDQSDDLATMRVYHLSANGNLSLLASDTDWWSSTSKVGGTYVIKVSSEAPTPYELTLSR